MHTILKINTWRTKETVKGQQKIEKIWHNKIAIIVDKINIVSLDLFIIVNLYLGETKALYKNLSTILGRLSIIILFNDFFYFSFVIGISL